ncbi:MAG: ABC transporter permease [Chloroflexi bacterium]|nr:ABC transporter permease [Chloroflexota bacterium]
MTWLIARRAAGEALRDRLTLLVSLFFAIVLPLGLVLFVVRPLADSDDALLGTVLGVYLLLVGLMPAVSAVGIAAGQFAGEKERGMLTPLLASPASNIAIFGGKVLGAIMPPLTYAVVGDSVYLIGVAVVLGPARLGLIPLALAIAMLILVPAMTAFAATIASLISSRVRTFNAAQQLAGLVLMPVWGAMLGVAIKLPEWGNAALFAALLGLVLVDGALLALSAATWRREEVLSHG